MPNSDNTYGTFNKTTRIYKILYAESWHASNNTVVPQNFGGNVETAKNFFFTTEALNNWNDTSTQIQWAITDAGNGIKVTNAFGTKGGNISESDDWTGIWNATTKSLTDAGNWIKSTALEPDATGDQAGFIKGWSTTESTDHLF